MHIITHLTYGSVIWFLQLTKAAQKTLYQLQKRIIRSVSGATFRLHCMTLFKKVQVLTIYDCVSVDNCKLVHRITSGQCAKPISNFFKTTNRQNNWQTAIVILS